VNTLTLLGAEGVAIAKQIVLVFFFLMFIVIVVRVVLGRKNDFDDAARIPLNDDEGHTS